MNVATAAAITIGAALLTAAPALAEPAVRRSEVVKLGDLDLSTHAGVAALRVRIERAAGRVCGGRPNPSPLMLTLHASWKACKTESANRAFAEVEARSGRLYAERSVRVVNR